MSSSSDSPQLTTELLQEPAKHSEFLLWQQEQSKLFQQLSEAICRNYISTINNNMLLIQRLQENGNTLLHVAAKYAKIEMIELMLSTAENILWADVKNKKGNTPLICACSKGRLNVARLLITKYNADVNAVGYYNSPLYGAIRSGNYELIKFLIMCDNIDPNQQTTFTGQTPLHAACSTNNAKAVDMLLTNKARIDVKDANGILPSDLIKSDEVRDNFFLHEISPVMNNFYSTKPRRYWLENIRNLSVPNFSNIDKYKVFEESNPVSADIYDAYGILGDKHVKQRFPEEKYCSLLHLMVKEKASDIIAKLLTNSKIQIDDIDIDLDTPLTYACMNGDIESVKVLIKHGADINSVGIHVGPLHSAIKNDYMEIVDYLLQQQTVDVNKKTLLSGLSPLHIACETGKILYVKKLIKHGANPTKTDSQCRAPIELSINVEIKEFLSHYEIKTRELIDAMVTNKIEYVANYVKERENEVFQIKSSFGSLLHLAANSSSTEMISMLIDNGHPIDSIMTPYNQTPLHSACFTDKLENIKLLCERGANAFARMRNGWTVLHLAAAHSSFNSIKYLLTNYPQLSKSVNLTDNEGNTPLTLACIKGQYDNVELLLKYGADINAMGQNQGPLHAAVRSENVKLVMLLLNQVNIDVNMQTTVLRTTALHVACEINNSQLVDFLLTKKTLNVDLRNVSDKLAIDIVLNDDIKEHLQKFSQIKDSKAIQEETSNDSENSNEHRNQYSSSSGVNTLITSRVIFPSSISAVNTPSTSTITSLRSNTQNTNNNVTSNSSLPSDIEFCNRLSTEELEPGEYKREQSNKRKSDVMEKDDDSSMLLFVYKTAFKNLRKFIEIEFPLNNLIILRQRNIIDSECINRIANASSVTQKPEIFMDYIMEQTDITKYALLLTLCSELKPSLFKIIQKEIERLKEINGVL